jgi:hypothetical protein
MLPVEPDWTPGDRKAARGFLVGHGMGHEAPRSPADLSQARFRQNRLKPSPTWLGIAPARSHNPKIAGSNPAASMDDWYDRPSGSRIPSWSLGVLGKSLVRRTLNSRVWARFVVGDGQDRGRRTARPARRARPPRSPPAGPAARRGSLRSPRGEVHRAPPPFPSRSALRSAASLASPPDGRDRRAPPAAGPGGRVPARSRASATTPECDQVHVAARTSAAVIPGGQGRGINHLGRRVKRFPRLQSTTTISAAIPAQR